MMRRTGSPPSLLYRCGRLAGNRADWPGWIVWRSPATVRVRRPSCTQTISRVAGACASPPNSSPGITSQRHSSTAQGGSVAPMIVPVPPAGPCHRTREASGLLTRTVGSPPRSTSCVTGTPNASPIRARVARFGLERPCSSATSTPLLTPERVAS
jgi:hypothetical protein